MTKPRWSSDDTHQQTGKVVVTGSNTGIGYEVDGVLANKKASVITATRDVSKGEQAYIGALDNGMIVTPGFSTVAQVLGNVGAREFGPLTAQQLLQIHTIAAESGG